MIDLRPIPVEELTVDDLEYLSQSTDLGYDDTRPVDVCAEALNGKALIWRFTGDRGETGILVTEINKRIGGLELYVGHLAGTNMPRCWKAIFKTMEEFGKEQGCRWIVGYSTRRAARFLGRALDFENKGLTLMVKEI